MVAKAEKRVKNISIKEHVKKHMDAYVFLLCVVMAIAVAFNKKFSADDELWNFANIYKMNNGYVIYKDLNVIITPLFFYIGQIFLKVFGMNFFAFRLYNLVITIFFAFTIYKIFNAMGCKKKSSLVYTIMLTGIVKPMITPGANYNNLAIIFYLLGIYINLIMPKEKKILPYLQGAIAFIIFLTKQNIGIYYLVASFIMHIMLAIKNKNVKQEAIKYIKEVLIFIALTATFALILYLQNNLYYFIDMCFLGISEFAKEVNAIHFVYVIMAIVAIISVGFSIFIIKSKKIKNKNLKTNNMIVLPFAIMNLLMMYPLFNEYHVYLAILFGVILIIVNLDQMIIEEMIGDEKLYSYIIIFFIVLIFGYTVISNCVYIKNINSSIDAYYGSVITEDKEEHISKICKFITENNSNGIDVKVLSYKANAYMVPLNKGNGTMDLPFYGNLGGRGEQGLIEDLTELENVKILIDIEENYFWQEAIGAIEYVKENYTYEGEIEEFLIYSK